MSAKETLVACIARYQAQIFRLKMAGIGNIFSSQKGEDSPTGPAINTGFQSNEESDITLGRIVSPIIFWGDHLSQKVPRGPFSNSFQWLHARLTLILHDQACVLKPSKDEDDLEDANDIKATAERLQRLLPRIIPDP